MKRTILIISIAFFSSILFAQAKTNNDIPEKVSTAFTAQYPSAQLKSWKTKKTGYIAEFTFEKKKYLAYYSINADWERTETKVASSAKLPRGVKEALHKSEYASWYITEITKVEKPGRYIYTIHVNDGNKLSADHHDALKTDYLLSYSDSGELLKKQRLH